MHFKEGEEWNKLDDEGYSLYKPDDYSKWPVIKSTVHPFAMIWKAVSEFGSELSSSRLICPSHVSLMATAQEICRLWKAYAETHRDLWSPEDRNRGPSPPSTPGSHHTSGSSQQKRRRSDDDGDTDGSHPSKRSQKSGGPQDAPDIVDDMPSMVSSEHDRTQSSPNLQSPSLVDRPVRVADEDDDEEEDSDDDEEYRPSALQPKRKFNISDWAKTASAQGEPVVEVKCTTTPGVSEKPRKPPRGTWKRWRPAYAQ